MMHSCHHTLSKKNIFLRKNGGILGGVSSLRRNCVLCKGGQGFGGDQKTKKEEELSGLPKRKVKRLKSKGKKTLRMGQPQEAISESDTKLTPEKEEFLRRAVTVSEGGIDPETDFEQRLMDLKKEGREKAAEKKVSRSAALYETSPDDASTMEEQKEADVGPGRGVLVGLSVALILIFLLSTADFNFLGGPRRRLNSRTADVTAQQKPAVQSKSADVTAQTDIAPNTKAD